MSVILTDRRRDLKHRLVAIGLRALRDGNMVRGRHITALIRKVGLRHA